MASNRPSYDYSAYFKQTHTNSDQSRIEITHEKGTDDDTDEIGEGEVDTDDEVTMTTTSLITSNRHTKAKHKQSEAKCFCDQNNVTFIFVISAIFFLIGLVTGLMIGRFNYSQSKTCFNDNDSAKNVCNCSIPIQENCTKSDETIRGSTTALPLTTTQSTTTETDESHQSTEVSDKSSTETKSVSTSIIITQSPKWTPSSGANITYSTKTGHTAINEDSKTCTFCKTRNPDQSTRDKSNESLFAPLTKSEMMAVKIVMETRGFVSGEHTLQDTRISHMYLQPVQKSAALNYLDKGGLFPGRFAKVHVVRPTNTPSDVMEYRVGPLNETLENIAVEMLRESGDIDFNRRPYDFAESNELYKLLNTQFSDIEVLLAESFDGIRSNTEDAYPSFSYMPTTNISDRTSHMVLMLEMGHSSTMHTLPISCTVHHPGSNVSLWFTSDWLYLDQGPFQSTSDLQKAYYSGKLRKIKFTSSYRKVHEADFNLVRNESLPSRELSQIPPPRTYEPEGPRYTINGHVVTWMGWQFEITSDPVRGPAVFDVRFQSQRIAYEISLQDITLLYSARSNGHGPLILSDTFYLIGSYNKPISEIDCPKRASILKASTLITSSPIEMDVICVFEADGQAPLWRHRSRGLADHYLVVRAAISLDNYDYIFEWNFHLDGRLQTLVTASGYLYGAFWEPNDNGSPDKNGFSRFGYKLGQYLLGPIHDHTFTFKVDLDILGTSNSFEILKWKVDKNGKPPELKKRERRRTIDYSHFNFNSSRTIASEILDLENSFVIDPLKPAVWTVVNENKTNAWGARRGYRIEQISKFAEILHDHIMLDAWKQLKYQIAVTKRKETEPYATDSLYDLIHPKGESLGHNAMKIDGDNVRDEDLVLWISEKFYHLPTSEDVPMTLPARVGFMLKPFNYYDRTPTFDLPANYDNGSPYNTPRCAEKD